LPKSSREIARAQTPASTLLAGGHVISVVGRLASGGTKMASQDKPNESDEEYNDTNEMKYMWIAVGVIVMVILGGMGINMLVHKESSAETVEMSTSQPTTPQR
jgi:hypothetical protein